MKLLALSSLAAALLASTLSCAAHAADVNNPIHPLTRAEVRADLEAWQRAGLADEWRGDGTPDIYSAEYLRKMATYERLRATWSASPTR
ncbi:DUF4148 domain-containing protein [Cupriavidus sp. RAF12]|uniref:DUF4148 domain-containing protein n=1 Tax=Cupriavidus sp. RAF12 TaxID=3233050 RepID=UPI003F8DAF92